MLEHITWAQFFTLIAILTLGYYAGLWLLLKKRKSGYKGTDSTPDGAEEKVAITEEDLAREEAEREFDTLWNLTKGIRTDILEKAESGIGKDALLRMLRAKVAGFEHLHRQDFRYALNNAIIEQAKSTCGVQFDEEELEAAWEQLLT